MILIYNHYIQVDHCLLKLQKTQKTTGIEIPGLVYDVNPDRLEAAYGKLIPVLVNAVKELKAELDAAKTRIATLEAG